MKVSVCGKVWHRKQDKVRHPPSWRQALNKSDPRCAFTLQCSLVMSMSSARLQLRSCLCSHDLRSNTRLPPSTFLPLHSHTFNVLSLADNLYLLGVSLVPLQLHTLIRTPARRWRRELEGGRGWREKKGMDGSCLTTKELGCTGAFSPSGLSAAPGSNIHLAWCIPGLETLMWFVGESRWQVHGSTLLTDSAGASGRVHNNTECLSPPSFALLSKHTTYPPPTLPSTHTQTDITFFFFSWYLCVGTGRLHKEPFGMLTFSSALSVLRSLVFPSPLTVPSLSIASLPASTPSLRLCTHLCCLTSLRSLLLPQHSCTCPLTRPPPSFGSHSLHQSLSSFLFLHLSCSPLHPPRRARTVPKYWKIWCLVLPLRCRNDVMQ